MKIAITGHRPNKLGNEYDLIGPITSKIKLEIEKILEREKPDTLISGMALGIDQLFALIGIERELKVIAAIPCNGQPDIWPPKCQDVYFRILNNPLVTRVLVNDCKYSAWAMQKRNEWMVEQCDKIIAVWDGSRGGTANCVRYAQSKNKQPIRIIP